MSAQASASAAPSVAVRLRWELSDSLVLARRNLAPRPPDPREAARRDVQPLMFVLLFAYVFSGVIHVPGGGYRQYLLGGILVQTLTFGIVGPATSIATDLTEGIVDRFRSLPMSRSAFLLGHLISDLAASMLALAIMTASGLIVGWRIHSDIPHAIAGFALLALFAFTMLWLGMLLGLLARIPRRRHGRGVHRDLPADVHRQHVRARRRLPAGLRRSPSTIRSARSRPPRERCSATPPRCPRTPVAAAAPRAQRARLVRARARDRRAADHPPLPRADRRLRPNILDRRVRALHQYGRS